MVRVGHPERPLGPVDRDRPLPVVEAHPRGEGGGKRPRRPRGEAEQRREVVRHLDVEGFAVPRARAAARVFVRDLPPRDLLVGEAADGGDGAEEVHQRRQVVRPHVEHRAAAPLVEELRVGVPVLHAAGEHAGVEVQRLPDEPVVDRLPGGLLPGAQESVRGGAHGQARGRGLVQEPLPLLPVHGQRLLPEDVLARGDGSEPGFRVGGRDRQVQHALDFLGREQLVHAVGRGHAEVRGRGFRRLAAEVGHGDDLEAAVSRGVGQVLLAGDVAAAEDADAEGLVGGHEGCGSGGGGAGPAPAGRPGPGGRKLRDPPPGGATPGDPRGLRRRSLGGAGGCVPAGGGEVARARVQGPGLRSQGTGPRGVRHANRRHGCGRSPRTPGRAATPTPHP